MVSSLVWVVSDSKPASKELWRVTNQSWSLMWHFVWSVGLCKHESHDDKSLACLYVADDLVVCSEGKKFLTFTLSPVCKQVFRLLSFLLTAANCCELPLNLLTDLHHGPVLFQLFIQIQLQSCYHLWFLRGGTTLTFNTTSVTFKGPGRPVIEHAV